MDAAAIAELAQRVPPLPQSTVPVPSESVEIHIDADMLAYYFAGNDDTVFGACRRNTIEFLENCRVLTGAAGRRILHLTSPVSTKGDRFLIATEKPYQGQRDSGRKPKNWQAMRNWLEGGDIGHGWRVKTWTDREADDGLAASARYALECGRTPVIVTRDKDLRMVPGRHVDWMTYGITDVPPDAFGVVDLEGRVYGAKWFWLQMLQGDTADNIPGCAKVKNAKGDKLVACGPKTAEALLANCTNPEECWLVVRQCYEDCYATAWADRLT